MRLPLPRVREYLRQSLWFIPMLGVTAAIVLAQLVPWLDRGYGTPFSDLFAFQSGPAGARLLLATIAASTLSLTALVFSVTMLVLQLATNQLSPRVMRTFLRDRPNQVVLALFIGTFSYSLLALRLIRPEDDGGVPVATAWLGFALALLSVAAFVYYIHHMAQSIRASTVLASIAAETREAIQRQYPGAALDEPRQPIVTPGRPADYVLQWPRTAGVVIWIDVEFLFNFACERAVIIAVAPMVGEFVPQDAPIVSVWGALDDDANGTLIGAFGVGNERSMEQDVAFGFRQLIDIAELALSPGINDPSTAVQAIDRIHDLLRLLATRAIPAAERVDDAGDLRLILPRLDWDEFVGLAIEEVRLYGKHSLQVVRQLRHMIEDVQAGAPPSRSAPLTRQLSLLDAGLRSGFELEEDRESARALGQRT